MKLIWGLKNLSQTLLPVDSITTIIVCPTPAGGHIEHACDLALATVRATGRRATVLSRAGASEYLPAAVRTQVDVREIIPPLVAPLEDASRRDHLARGLTQLLRLVQEHWRVWSELRSIPGPKVLVLEEPRYPFPQVFRATKGATRICLMLHNAVEHAVSGQSPVSRIKAMIASRVRSNVDFIAVHGERQRELVQRTSKAPVRSFPLPGDSYLNEARSESTRDFSYEYPNLAGTFVCLGEIRENKGIEIAIEAAKQSGMELLVIGKAIDPPYLRMLTNAASDAANVRIQDDFISAELFDYILSNCGGVLLPYSQFDAQSGVLARALKKQISVVAADLPSLREQAFGASQVSFFSLGSSVALAAAMTEMKRTVSVDRGSKALPNEVSIPEWNDMAVAMQLGW